MKELSSHEKIILTQKYKKNKLTELKFKTSKKPNYLLNITNGQ